MKITNILKVTFTVALCLHVLPLTAHDNDNDQESTEEIDPFEEEDRRIEEKRKASEKALAQKKDNPVLIYHEVIEIPALQYAEIMSNKLSLSDHTTLRNQLMEMVKQGSAKLITNDSIITNSGSRATVESHQELFSTSEDKDYFKNREKTEPFNTKNVGITTAMHPFSPTNFQIENIGDSLEVEPILTKGKQTIHLTYRPEHTRHTGDDVYSEWLINKKKSQYSHLKIYNLRTNTSMTLNHGQFSLVTTYSPELDGITDHTRKCLIFIKASILTVE